jgi:hypothetical protein
LPFNASTAAGLARGVGWQVVASGRRPSERGGREVDEDQVRSYRAVRMAELDACQAHDVDQFLGDDAVSTVAGWTPSRENRPPSVRPLPSLVRKCEFGGMARAASCGGRG